MEKTEIEKILGDYLEDEEPPKAKIVIDAEDDGTGRLGMNMEIEGRGDIVLYATLSIIDTIADKLGKVKTAGLLAAYADQLLHEGTMSEELDSEEVSFEDDDTDVMLS